MKASTNDFIININNEEPIPWIIYNKKNYLEGNPAFKFYFFNKIFYS